MHAAQGHIVQYESNEARMHDERMLFDTCPSFEAKTLLAVLLLATCMDFLLSSSILVVISWMGDELS